MSNETPEGGGRERSLANLRPFRKGQSGNPAGRPKAVLSAALRKKLEEFDPRADGAQTNAERIAERVVALAVEGNLEAVKICLDRLEGRPRQSVTVTTGSRERVERAVGRLVEAAREGGDELSRAEALALLAEYDEEAAALAAEEGE